MPESRPLICFFMDQMDLVRPKFPVRTPNVTFRWSVGCYKHPKKRTVLAWFVDADSAWDYCLRLRRQCPTGMFDVLSTLF